MRFSPIILAQAFAVSSNAIFLRASLLPPSSISNLFDGFPMPLSSIFKQFMVPPRITKAQLLQMGVPPRHVPFDDAFSSPSISRIVRIPCDGCFFQSHNSSTGVSDNIPSDIVLDFTIPKSNRSTMTLNGLNIIPVASAGGHQLTVGQIPQDTDTITYIMERHLFPTVPVNHSRIMREETNSRTGAKKFVITVNIASVNHTAVSLKGLEMTVFQDPVIPSHIADFNHLPMSLKAFDGNLFQDAIKARQGALHFGPVSSIPKSEGCGLNLSCIMAKIFHEAPAVPAPWTPGKMPSCGDDGVMESPEEEEEEEENNALPPLSAIPLSSIPTHPQILFEPKQTMLRRIVRQVLLPVFVGIAVGMAVSLFGLVVGHIFVAIWRRVSGRRSTRTNGTRWFRRFRRDRGGRDNFATKMADGEVEKALLPETEAPPAYADEEDEDVDAVEKD